MKTPSLVYLRFVKLGFILFILLSASVFYFSPVYFNIELVSEFKSLHLLQTIIYIVSSLIFMFLAIFVLKQKSKKIVSQYNETLHRFEALGNATNDAIWDYDMVTEKVFYNKRILDIFGYTDEELKDNTSWWENNIHPADIERVKNRIDEQLAGTLNSWEDEYKFRCKNGTYKIVYDRSYITRDNNGKPTRLIGAMKDITHLRAIEKELHKQQLEHKNLLGKEVIVSHENEKKKIKDQLNEDVNQILVSIKFYISMLRAQYKNENITIGLNHLDDAIKKIRTISNTLFSSTFELLGLTEALKELFNVYQNEKPVKINFLSNTFNEANIDKDLSLHIYRIVEDRLENVVGKIGAKEVNIFLTHTEEKPELKIVFDSNNSNVLNSLDDYAVDLKRKMELFGSEMKIENNTENIYTISIIV
jgi:two-component system, NarL family, sensor histidine kinase UhpB